ncbi:hypothetical protein [Ruminococcus sp.]|uniref:hypothetical protein n=1 Tax=Ruminococcus sp. TaxID=41978 RepID=UPI0025F933F6|nr:hypothetical protein [Ruminococcus sp.]
MKNRKLFTVVVVLFLLIALSVPFAAGVFYDPDNGAVYASSWTFWDPDQPAMSIPYLDVNTTIRGINNTHAFNYVRTDLYYCGSQLTYYEHNEGYEDTTDYYFPVPAPDANLYSSLVTFVGFE